MTDQPDALRLADALEYASGNMRSVAHQAAAELRRLHAENARMREAAHTALEVLESLQGGCTDSDDGTVEALTVYCPEAIGALREALGDDDE